MTRFLYIRRVHTDFLSLLKIASCEKERESCNGMHFGSQMKGREYLELRERLTAYEKKCLLIDSSPLICDCVLHWLQACFFHCQWYINPLFSA